MLSGIRCHSRKTEESVSSTWKPQTPCKVFSGPAFKFGVRFSLLSLGISTNCWEKSCKTSVLYLPTPHRWAQCHSVGIEPLFRQQSCVTALWNLVARFNLLFEMPESRNLCVGAMCGLGDYYTLCILVVLSEGVRELFRSPWSRFWYSFSQKSFSCQWVWCLRSARGSKTLWKSFSSASSIMWYFPDFLRCFLRLLDEVWEVNEHNFTAFRNKALLESWRRKKMEFLFFIILPSVWVDI